MREIKFRAWIKKEKVIVDVDLIDFRENEIVCLEYCDIGLDFNYSFKDIELMQYTGLKDNNGKEIYEGDIIKVYEEGYELGTDTVIFEEQSASFKLVLANDKYMTYTITQKWANEFAVVVGNIYENPELWEVEE